MPRRKAPAPSAAGIPRRNVVPDALDLRDRPYQPSIAVSPALTLAPQIALPVLNQQDSSACTGFALASVVHHLQRRREPKTLPVSPWMIYSMARRYDEFPGAAADTGSSLRGAMKGWYRHGVCRATLWQSIAMPPAAKRAGDDWWLDAARRPLGAYYRVESRSITDMQVALNEVGILYASAVCHAGWNEGMGATRPGKGWWPIPPQKATPDDGGHAFAIVGYTPDGFIIQNSWGSDWGSEGLAILSYEDWLANAMDCWVAQLGVVTEQHLEIAAATSLRVEHGRVRLAGDLVLRDREISPFVIDMENNGQLSGSGRFRTQRGDVAALVGPQLAEARRNWGLKPDQAVDIAIYAHGGLVGEDDAAATAALWIPALYEAKIFPIFLMWESDLLSTLKNRLADLVSGQPRPAAGLGDLLKRFWNQRVERLLAAPGSVVWGEMKQNADAISATPDSGGRLLHDFAATSPVFTQSPVRLHLIGHSAGAIVHSHLVERLCALGWTFDTLNLMAPAVSVELFSRSVLPRLQDGGVRQLNQFHLGDAQEQADPSCMAILYYMRSLLYLVSESFEGGRRTPLLGMEKYWQQTIGALNLPKVRAWSAPGSASQSATHGGFGDDAATRASVIALIRTGTLP